MYSVPLLQRAELFSYVGSRPSKRARKTSYAMLVIDQAPKPLRVLKGLNVTENWPCEDIALTVLVRDIWRVKHYSTLTAQQAHA